MQRPEETVERHQGAVGILSLRKLVEQNRHQLGEMLARELAPQRAIFAVEPARDRGRRFRRLLKPSLTSPSTVARIVVVDRTRVCRAHREVPAALRTDWRSGAARCANGASRTLRESVAAGKSHEPREALQGGALGRQRVGLFVGHHLQPVLDGAQEAIGRVEFGASVGLDPAVLRERLQYRQTFRARAVPGCGRRRSVAASARRIRSHGCRRGQA